MNPLSDLATDRIIASSNEDALKKLIQKAAERLKSFGQYKIIIEIHHNPLSIFKGRYRRYSITERLESMQIYLTFYIKLFDAFPQYQSYDVSRTLSSAILSSKFLEMNPIHRSQVDILLLTRNSLKPSTNDHLIFILRMIYEYKDDVANQPLLLGIYEQIMDKRLIYKVGFNLEESLKIYEILNEIMTEIKIPEYFDLERLFTYEFAYLYEYIVCYYDKRNSIRSFIVKDREHTKIPLRDMNEYQDAKIYQVI